MPRNNFQRYILPEHSIYLFLNFIYYEGLFSVVIPLFNKANYIKKAIDSVLSQTFLDYELIVVDDGSTDDGLERSAGIVDERLRVITQANAGVSAARNKGVQYSKYRYVAFLDADDWWDAHFLAGIRDLIADFPEAALYGTSYYIVKNGRNQPADIGVEPNFQAGYIHYFNVYAATFWVPINCSFVVVEKSAFVDAGGFRATLKFGEDFDLWVRLALVRKVAYLNKCLAFSNQDVEADGRALGMQKAWQRDEHIIFNLDSFVEAEQRDPAIKFLFDGLRVRSLVGFYLTNQHPEAVKSILRKVNFDMQPFLYRFIYRWPRPLVDFYFQTKKTGSYIKQLLLRSYRAIN